MINGPNIGEAMPVITYPGVTIKRVNKADSKNGLLVNFAITKNTRPGTFAIQFRKGTDVVSTVSYSLLPHQQEAT